MAIIPRKWRWLAWLAAALACTVAAYALAGFFIAPYLAQQRLWPLLSETLGGQFEAERIAFNPFSLTIEVDGFSLKTPEGNVLAEIGEAGIDLDLTASLHAQALVAKARIDRPSVNLLSNKQGKPNYAFLIPKGSKEEASAEFPFLLTELAVGQGRLAFEDQSRGKGFKQVFQPLDFRLSGLGTASKTPAHFKLETQGEGKETLVAEGEFHLRQIALNGEAKLEGLSLAPLAEWLVPGLPYTVRDGVLSLALKYHFSQETGFDITAAEGQIKAFGLAQESQPFLDTVSISAQGLSFQGKTGQATLKTLSLENLRLQSPTPVELVSITVQGLNYQAQTDQFDAQSLSVEKATLKSPAPVELASINAQGLSYQRYESRLGLKSLSAANLKASQNTQPLVEVGGIAAQDFVFNIAKGGLGFEFLKLDNIALKSPTPVVDKEGNARQFQVESLELGGLGVDMPGKSVEISMTRTNRSFLAAWLGKDGSAGFSGLPPNIDQAPAGSKDAANTGDKPWQVKVERAELNDNTILLRDFGFDPPVKMRLSNLNLLVKAFDSAADQPFWLGLNTALSMNGRIALEGQVKLSPLAVDLKLFVDDLSLPPFQAYLDPFVRIRMVKGTLNTNADIGYDEADGHKLRIGGDVAVANFASTDKQEQRDFANWKGMRLNGLIFESSPRRLSIRDIAFTEPYLRAIIGPDQQFNIAENLSPPASPKTVPQAKPDAPPSASNGKAEEPLSVVIGAVNFNQGTADFVDLSIKPTPFWIGIHGLSGNIRSLSSRQDTKSDVLLEGKLNEGSAVKIFGKINPFSPQAFTDITMNFNRVNLTSLSPYAAKFAGYRIEKGNVSMDLHYTLDNGQLTADNNFVLDQLVLGEQVESPNATTLPVRLAVSLLKDADGKIDISLPISGDLSNPNISIRSLLAAASKEFINKLVTSPLTILGSLFGGSTQDLESVKFAPGLATLSTLEKEKLATVAKALHNRPALSLDIKGSADTELDRPVLAEMDLTQQLKNAKLIELGRKKGQKAEWDGMTLSEEDYNRLFTNLYRWKSPNAQELKDLKTGAYLSGSQLETAKRTLLEKWSVSEMVLRGLAQARGESIRNYLVKDQGLADQRIYLLDVKLSQSHANEIKVLLSLSGP